MLGPLKDISALRINLIKKEYICKKRFHLEKLISYSRSTDKFIRRYMFKKCDYHKKYFSIRYDLCF